MLTQLAIGTLVVIVNVIVQAEMFSAFAGKFETILLSLRPIFRRFANTAAIVMGALFVMLVQTVNVWIWAVVFYLAGAFSEFEPALYFSLVSFTTVGFGDIVPVHPVARSMATLEALVGQLYPAVLLARLVTLYQK